MDCPTLTECTELTDHDSTEQLTPIQVHDTVVLVSPLNSYDGYGMHGSQIANDFLDWGYNMKLRAHMDEHTVKGARVPDRLKRCIVHRDELQPHPWELILWPPQLTCSPGKRTVYFTMWESTRLPQGCVQVLNQAEVVVVPCEWNRLCFTAEGVTAPIRVCQLGIHTHIFTPSPMDMNGPTIFGTAGRLAGGGHRKGLSDVIDAFLLAFPREHNVRLRIKCFPDCPLPTVRDPRIQLTRALLTWEEMANWIRGLTCFVSASKGEGFGLIQLQALACGRPLIAAKFSGLTEFFNDQVGYPVPYKLIEATGTYANCGHSCLPSVDGMVERMRHMHANREEAREKGEKGAKSTAHMSWQRASGLLLNVMKEVGMVSATS